MRVKVTSDGDVCGTRVMNAETGELIDGVYCVDIHHEAGGIPQVELAVRMPEISGEYNARLVARPSQKGDLGNPLRRLCDSVDLCRMFDLDAEKVGELIADGSIKPDAEINHIFFFLPASFVGQLMGTVCDMRGTV